VIRTPAQAPNANAHAERWVGSVRRECLDRLLIFSRRQLEQVLRVYARHYNRHRPHRSLAFRPPEQEDRSPTPRRAPPYPQLNRRDLLGGLIHEYEYAARHDRSPPLPRRHALFATLSLRRGRRVFYCFTRAREYLI
jgi:putative transposase